MANKWAIQNGNWSDGSTWNDGVVPTADDDVWLNGKIVNITNTNVIAKKITNENYDELILGGYLTFDLGTDNFIQADLYNFSQYVILSGGQTYYQNYSLTINGNLYNYNRNGSAIYGSAAKHRTNITGNIVGCLWSSSIGAGNAQIEFNILGNFDADGDDNIKLPMGGYGKALNITITGITTITNKFDNGQRGGSWIFNGGIKLLGDNATLESYTANTTYSYEINGYLDISNTSNKQILYSSLGTIKTTNGLRIVDADKEIPPESVVLEGYEYGGKVGTLKTVPDNVAIVNLTEQEVNRVKNCATVSTVQKCFEDFKEE